MKPASVLLTVLVLIPVFSTTVNADVIVMKNGESYEAVRHFRVAGNTLFLRNGKLASVPDAEIEKIDIGATLAAAPQPAVEAVPVPAEVLKNLAVSIDKTEWEFIRDCRKSFQASARQTKSQYRENAARAILMVERMYEGTMPEDGTFGYYLGVLNNPLTWEILPAQQSIRLKNTIFKTGSPVNEFMEPYNTRLKSNAVKAAVWNAQTAQVRKALKEQEDAQIREEARKQLQAYRASYGSASSGSYISHGHSYENNRPSGPMSYSYVGTRRDIKSHASAARIRTGGGRSLPAFYQRPAGSPQKGRNSSTPPPRRRCGCN